MDRIPITRGAFVVGLIAIVAILNPVAHIIGFG